MWSKTLIGTLVSMLVTMSLILNLAYLLPVAIDVYLFVAFISFFLVWAGLLSYFYSLDKITQGLKICVPVLVLSAALNGAFYTGVFA